MPLTSKGRKVMAAMRAEYGKRRGESVFYASKNSGRLTGVDEFSEKDHPRNAGGQFDFEPSKGGKWEFGSGTVPHRNSDVDWEPMPFPMASLHNHLKINNYNAKPSGETSIPLKDLHVWQGGVTPSKLRPLSGDVPPIEVAKLYGRYIVRNGNHRATSAFVQGDPSIRANLTDFDLPGNRKYVKKYDPSSVHDSARFRDALRSGLSLDAAFGYAQAAEAMHTGHGVPLDGALIHDCLRDSAAEGGRPHEVLARAVDRRIQFRGARDAFSETDHPRGEGGKFGTVLTKGKHYTESHTVSGKSGKLAKQVPSQLFNVHHNGKHLGEVATQEVTGRVKASGGREFSSGKTSVRWGVSGTKNQNGRRYEGGVTYSNKNDAVADLKRHHGVKDAAPVTLVTAPAKPAPSPALKPAASHVVANSPSLLGHATSGLVGGLNAVRKTAEFATASRAANAHDAFNESEHPRGAGGKFGVQGEYGWHANGSTRNYTNFQHKNHPGHNLGITHKGPWTHTGKMTPEGIVPGIARGKDQYELKQHLDKFHGSTHDELFAAGPDGRVRRQSLGDARTVDGLVNRLRGRRLGNRQHPLLRDGAAFEHVERSVAAKGATPPLPPRSTEVEA